MIKKILVVVLAVSAVGFGFANGQPEAKGKDVPRPVSYEGLKVGVLLHGCGVQDGTEIQEAVLTLLALDKAGAQVVCFAPDLNQADVVDHVSGTPAGENRNMLRESARIVHGNIVPIGSVNPAELDAVITVGGLGFIKSVTTFAADGAGFTVIPDLENLLRAVHDRKKPIGFMCITPILAARLFGSESVRLTTGSAGGIADVIQSFGAVHAETKPGEIIVDEKARIVSTPAYMLGPSISAVNSGIEKLVAAVLEMAVRQ